MKHTSKSKLSGNPDIHKILDSFLEATGVDPESVSPDALLVEDLHLSAGQIVDLHHRINQQFNGRLGVFQPKDVDRFRTLRDFFMQINRAS